MLLHKRDDFALIAPSDLAVAGDAPGMWERMRESGTRRALILVGDEPRDHPAVQELLESPNHDNVAYVEAGSGRTELRRRWRFRIEAFSRRDVPRLAMPRKPPKVSAQQALSRLERDLQSMQKTRDSALAPAGPCSSGSPC